MRLTILSLFLLVPLTARAQPDPYEPSPLVPGTFELTVFDGGERTVEGMATFTAYPVALGGGWTLLLDDGTELFAVERAAPPTHSGAEFGHARGNDEDPEDALAYVRLNDESAGVFSAGAAPPTSPNRLAIAETNAEHTIGAFDFSAVRVMPDGVEGRLRIAGRFHALKNPNSGDGNDGGTNDDYPPISSARDCPDVWDWMGGIYGGLGSWSGYMNLTNVGGPVTLTDGSLMGTPGWQFQVANGCNLNLPGAYNSTFSHIASNLRGGIYRITNGLLGQPPGLFEVTAGLGAMYDRAYVFVSGYFWISHIGADRVTGTYSGYAASIPYPDRPPGPIIFTYGRFSARPPSTVSLDNLPPGFELPPGVELPPGIELPTSDGDN